MRNQTRYIILFIFLISTFAVQAQQDTSLTREVEVTKAFKPTMSSDANKISVMPQADKTEHKPPTFEYNIFSQPILSTFSVTPLKAATISTAQKKETGYGLVRVGVGNYNKPYAELFFNHLNSKNSVIGIHAKHLSSHGKITLDGGDKVDAPFAENDAELYYKQNLSKSILSVTADFDHKGFNYYGYPNDPIPPILLNENQEYTLQGKKQAFSKGGLNIKLKNHAAEMDDPAFNFSADYHYFQTKTEQKEHFAAFESDFQKPFDSGTLIGDAGLFFVQSDSIYNTTLNQFGKRSQTWLYVKPAFYLEGKNASISIGANAWFVMDKDMDAVAKVTPNIRAEYMPVEDVFKLFAGVDGNYRNNHYSKIAYENPFIDPFHDVTNSFEKLHFFGGFDGKFSAKTNFKISVDYSMIDNQHFYYLNENYLPDPIINPNPLVVNNTFTTVYDDINLLKINLELFHASSEKLNLLLSGNYYSYNLSEIDEAWNMPGWDAKLSLDYKITEQLSVGSDIYLIGARKALIIEHAVPVFSSGISIPTFKSFNLDTAFDLNVNANYQITEKLAAFAQLNNFGFQKYQRWFGYPVQSFNALAGISYAF